MYDRVLLAKTPAVRGGNCCKQLYSSAAKTPQLSEAHFLHNREFFSCYVKKCPDAAEHFLLSFIKLNNVLYNWQMYEILANILQ